MLIHSSKGVLAQPETRDLGEPAAGSASSVSETARVEERRRSEELTPDIIALIASCGEKVRRTDKIAVPTEAKDRASAPVKASKSAR